jgi:hypothetical protein
MKLSGLKAILTIAAIALVSAPTSASALEFVPGSATVQALTANGRALSQAAGHPASFNFNFELVTNSEGVTEGGQARGIVVGFPLGFYGNPLAVPRCTRADFDGNTARCPLEAQIGVVRAITPVEEIVVPLFNLEPAPGVVAEFGTNGIGLEALVFGTVRSEAGPAGEPAYQVIVTSPNLPIEIIKASVTIWGVPSESSHDAQRGETALNGSGEPQSSNAPPLAFLTLPSSCDTPPVTTISVESTLAPGSLITEPAPFFDTAGNVISLSGCDSVPFSPRIVSAPTIGQAEGSSGLRFQLSLPNQGLTEPGSIAEAQPKKAEVVLPQGITVNPAAANGIAGCSEAQFRAADGEPGQGCPEASKIGTLTAKSPLLEELIEGSVYLAQPHANRFNSLLALYIVAKAPERGVLVKAPGVATADPVTGQLTATFDELPPIPYSFFEVNLREGPRAPLITPQTCGTYETVARLYPYSAPTVATVRTAPFKITAGANGGACASSEAALPARPAFEAGTVNPLAGAYSPFVFRVKRSDGEQRLSSVSATLPAGLVGSIAGVPYCPESGIATAAARAFEGGGTAEIASPSCPAASQVGIVNVSAGAGAEPFFVQGKAYLAGPYKGAPLSVEIITPAIAGPFDLGSVAVRTALYVNESTAQIHAVSDPLPTILHGIPLGVRTISLQMNRSNFTLNPTNCQAKTVTGSVTTLVGGVANLSAPFAANGCKGLAFKPDLKLSFTGQTKRTGFPAVKAVLTQPKGQNANLAGVSVVLPKGMLIANAHINNPCTRVQFNSTSTPGEGCPAKSVLGTAKAWTPLLDQPETGKVYFRSNGGERELPDIVVALRGQVPLQLVGFIDSVGKKNAEVRRVRSRFQNVPDAPVSRFELNLSGGAKGLLQNSKNLCKAGDRATFDLTGQNGKTQRTEPKVQVSCGKGKKKGSKNKK